MVRFHPSCPSAIFDYFCNYILIKPIDMTFGIVVQISGRWLVKIKGRNRHTVGQQSDPESKSFVFTILV